MALRGLIFNATGAAFVTPGALEYFPTGDFDEVTYPETLPSGPTVGWESFTGTTGVSAFDLNAALDRRLAGCQTERNSGDTATFRWDLDAVGDKLLYAAFGTNAYSWTGATAQFFDSASSLGGSLFTGCTSGNYRDATGVNRSTANWPTLNAANTQTFATTIWRTRIGAVGAATRTPIAYLGYDTAGGGAAAFTQRATLVGFH